MINVGLGPINKNQIGLELRFANGFLICSIIMDMIMSAKMETLFVNVSFCIVLTLYIYIHF